MSKSTSKNIGFLAGIGVLMVALIGGGIVLTKNIGKSIGMSIGSMYSPEKFGTSSATS